MSTAIVTGVSGFVGNHLSHYLEADGWHVTGIDKKAAVGVKDMVICDVCDKSTFRQALEKTNPEYIFHLAGKLKSHNPDDYFRTHVLGTINLFESLAAIRLHPKILIASSSAVYGNSSKNRRFTEKIKTRPVTYYGISKLVEEIISLTACRENGIPVVCMRTFNLIGPGLSESLVCSAIARRIAVAELDGENIIHTGNLTAQRDFVDVRDAVRAYAFAALKAKSGQIYNVCSGRSTSIQKCIELLVKFAHRPLRLVLDPMLVQLNDVSEQVGSYEKLKISTGWRPSIKLETSLADLLTYWRQKMSREKSGIWN